MHPAYSFVHAKHIKNDIVCVSVPGTKKWEYKAVLHVGALSFRLLSDTEQEAVLESFRAFLMRISTETVIHIRIQPYTLSYLDQFHKPYQDDAIAALAQDHEQFILSYAASQVLLQRDFYIITGADTQDDDQNALTFETAKSQLEMRCNDIIQDLEKIGVKTQRLNNEELANYYLSIMNTHYAQENPIEKSTLLAVDEIVQSRNSTGIHGLVDSKQPEGGDEISSSESLGTSYIINLMRESTSIHVRLLARFLGLVERSKQKREQAKQDKQRRKQKQERGSTLQLVELLQPASVEVRRTYLRMNTLYDEYLRFFAVHSYPREVYSGWLDRLCSIDEPYIELCLHIAPLDTEKYVQKLSRKLVSFTGTQKVSMDRGRALDPYITNAMKDVTDLRDKLVRQEEQIYGFALYLLVRSATKAQLEDRTRRLHSQLRTLNLRSIPLTMRHHKALHCFLPGHDELRYSRLFDTSSLVTAFPFTDNRLATDTGIVRGVTPEKSLVIIDPFDKSIENPHECTIGASGVGKSFTRKISIMRSLAIGQHVVVLDPEGEYLELAHRMNGTVIELASGMLKINPFRLFLLSGDEDSILEEKCQSLLVLFDLLLAEKGEVLKQEEKAYLSRCIAHCYLNDHDQEFGMKDFYETLRSEVCGLDTFHLADRLERFVPMFPLQEQEHDEVTLDTPLIVFNMRDLEDDLRDTGVFLVTMAVWSRIRKQPPSKRKPRMLVIDETWRFLKLPTSAEFLVHIIRLARKYYLSMNTNIHDAREFFASEWGQAIWTNSALKFVMKQNSGTINDVTDILGLSQGERKYLLSCGIGEGIYCARGVRVPMKVIASELEYAIANTNPRELQEELLTSVQLNESVGFAQ